MKLLGRVAIITGAASGIGQASTLAFAAEGARVVAVDINRERGEQTVREVRDAGGEACFECTDVSKESAVAEMISRSAGRWGRIDILFNNAGVVLVKELDRTTEEEWDRLMAINLKAAFLTIKHVIPHMRRSGRGVILNTGSIGSIVGQLGTPAYIASKGAIALMTKSLALDYARDGIRVNCLCPGITDTSHVARASRHGAASRTNSRTASLSRSPWQDPSTRRNREGRSVSCF